jgi:hypothetical protein
LESALSIEAPADASPRLIPTVDDLAADPITRRFDDMFAPPGLTNFLGAAQVDHDVVAVRSVNFPPVGQGDTVTGQLFLDGRLFRSFGAAVTFTWRPDRVTRRAEVGDLAIETVTACVPGQPALVVDIRITNRSAEPRTVTVGLSIESGAVVTGSAWRTPHPPSAPNVRAFAAGRSAVVARPRALSSSVGGSLRPEGFGVNQFDTSVGPPQGGASVQGVDVDGAAWEQGVLSVPVDVSPGGTARVGYVHATGRSEDEALACYDAIRDRVGASIDEATAMWNRELAAMFTPGNDSYAGCLPVLETSSDALRRIYWWGALGVLWFRRDSPYSVLGRSYDTLMPRYWQTCTVMWDYSMSSLVHALLDPTTMRRHLEHWVSTDIHTHFGTDWQTGGRAGNWYSVNDFAMTRMVREYVRWTGDRDFLDAKLASGDADSIPIIDHLKGWATAWEDLRTGHALADYGPDVNNLLECVSTYRHEVAAFNAANVWCLRVAADALALHSRDDEAADLRSRADALVSAVQELYVDGAGYWCARYPDGSLVPVRHCYDFNIVGFALADDLPDSQREEMVAFFQRELQTPSWIRALSASDPDASFSLRPDHQWNGAYPAWPPDAATALIRLGRPDVANAWLPGLALSANQGPCGQAHFVAEAADPVNGGAVKAPPIEPYINDWACSSSGAWVSLVVEGIFGVRAGLDGTVDASPQLEGLDVDARLTGLVIGGRSYDVDRDGIRPVAGV